MNTSYLHFSEDYIELSLTPGEVREGSFMLFGDVNRPLKGYVTSHDLEMNCLVTELNPEGTVINYTFDGSGLQLGDFRDGSFSIITNQGETTLKYHCMTVSPSPITSMGQINNLYQFTKLARKNWIEAYTFFKSPYFKAVIEGEDNKCQCLYQGLKKSTDSSLALEEFLIGIGKKSPVEFETETKEINLVSALDISQERISIVREGWGHSALYVDTNGAFLSVVKKKIDYDDFLGNRCTISVDIDPNRLHAGRNYGQVTLKNEYVSIEIPVCIVNVKELTLNSQSKNKEKIIQAVKKYIDYSLGKISFDEYARHLSSILNSMMGRRSQNVIRDLVRAHLYFDEGKYNEGRFLLKNAEKNIDFESQEEEVYCYARFLNWMANKTASNWRKIYDEIKAILVRNPGNWQVAWFVVTMNKERPTGSENWRILEECYKRDARSPLVYLEALKFLEDNMGRMANPTDFVVQILTFAVKNDFLTDDMIFQIHYLAGRYKKYSQLFERILKKCFEVKGDDESLFALCTHIMRNSKQKPEYLEYYEEAIVRQLRVGNIYEAYIDSAMESEALKIHENAIRYLFYQEGLPIDKKAFLYSRVVTLENEQNEIYQLFKRDMIEFTVEQFEAGNINRDLATLYRQFLKGVYVRPENIIKFMTVFSCYEVTLKSGDEDRIVVVSPMYENEIIHKLIDGKKYVSVWGTDSQVLLLSKDEKVCRCPQRLEIKPLFSRDDLLSVISRLEIGVSGVLMGLFFDNNDNFNVNEDNFEIIKTLCSTRKLSAKAESRLILHLMRFYALEERYAELEALLLSSSPQCLTLGMRNEMLDVMCRCGLYEKAFSWVAMYGTEGVSPNNLTSICHHLIHKRENVSVEMLLKLTYKVYLMGYYTKRMLNFLADFFNGSCNEMWKLKKSCTGFLLENQNLNERLIKRVTHTGKHLEESIELYKSYIANGGHTKVALSFLATFCRDCFRKGAALSKEMLDEVSRLYLLGVELPDDIQLETLKTLANQETIPLEYSSMITHMVETFVFGREMFFDFFRNFGGVCPIIDLYQDKTVLEYTAKSDAQIVLHYVSNIDGKTRDGAELVYVASPMEQGYNGTYTKEFVLFFGDRVDYYITEGNLEEGRLADQGSLVCTDFPLENENSRYGLINGMCRAMNLGNMQEAQSLYEIYEEREKYSEELFKLI